MVFQSFFGLFALTFIAWTISEKRSKVNFRVVVISITMQIFLLLIFLKVPFFAILFKRLNELVLMIKVATNSGTSFVFGYLGGGALPFETKPESSSFVLAFDALPLILVVSALSALLFYLGVIPAIVKVFAAIFKKTVGIGGAAALCSSANIFVGMVEAPIFVRPYISSLSRSELFILMTTGMATIAGNMMVLYSTIIGAVLPSAMGHILTASIISAPAAIMMALVIVPEEGEGTDGELPKETGYSSAMDAITKGTMDGVSLLINIVAMLIVLVALVTLLNMLLALLPDLGSAPITLQRIFGYLMAPVVWLMGIPANEMVTAGALMGTKTVLNEFIAYLHMADLPPEALSERSRIIMTYAMCGFANFGSLGIIIGGLGAMAPDRREEIIGLGFKSIVAGTLATCMTGAVVGLIL